MTPTEQDNELRQLVHMIQNADTTYDAMQFITTDRKRVALEARIDEAKKAQLLVCEYSEVDDNIELLRANRDLLERVAQLSKLKEEV